MQIDPTTLPTANEPSPSSIVPDSSLALLTSSKTASGAYLVPVELVIGLDSTRRPSIVGKDMLLQSTSMSVLLFVTLCAVLL